MKGMVTLAVIGVWKLEADTRGALAYVVQPSSSTCHSMT